MDIQYTEPLYRPLDPSRQEIRLLEIVSTEPDIVCSLSVVSLLDKPDFFALSYVWGDVNDTKEIVVNGNRLVVTRNLAGALRDVQYHWETDTVPDTPHRIRRLWADAVCINQQDIPERNHQVPFMKRIYPQARCVFSWIGRPTDELNASMDLINLFGSEIQNLMNRHGRDLSYLESWGRGAMDISKFIEEDPISWIHNHPHLHAPSSWRSLQQLFETPYWERVWIFQEILLATNMIYICGSRSAPHFFMSALCTWGHWVHEVHSKKLDNKPTFLHDVAWLYLMNYKTTTLMIDSVKLTKDLHEAVASKLPPEEDLGYDILVFMYASSFSATDPKDYVYALAGLTYLQIEPDYSSMKTAADVYCDFVTAWLNHLDMAKSRRLRQGLMVELWFLQFAGCGNDWKDLDALPSWAPNFRYAAKAISRNTTALRMPTSKSMFGACDLRIEIDNRHLICPGIKLDMISSTPKLLASEDEKMIHDIIDLVRTSAASPDVRRALTTVSRLIESASQGIAVPSVSSLIQVLYWQYLADVEDAKFETLSRLMDTKKLPPRLGVRYIWENEIYLKEFLEFVRLPDSSDVNPGGGSIDDFVLYMVSTQTRMKSLKGNRMGYTLNGLMGLFPPGIEVGDVIFLLKGCNQPIVLREEGGCFVNVGICILPDRFNDDGSIAGDYGPIEMIRIV